MSVSPHLQSHFIHSLPPQWLQPHGHFLFLIFFSCLRAFAHSFSLPGKWFLGSLHGWQKILIIIFFRSQLNHHLVWEDFPTCLYSLFPFLTSLCCVLVPVSSSYCLTQFEIIHVELLVCYLFLSPPPPLGR